MFRGWTVVVVVCAIGAGLAAVSSEPLSPRNANYSIEARLDPESKLLEGSQVLTWTNLQQTSTDELWFHLYWNAWRNNQSTWLREDRLAGRSDRTKVREEDWGWLEVATVRLLVDEGEDEDEGSVDLTPGMRFESPDDGNPHDRTVMVVALPEAVGPGQTVQVELTWSARVPRTFARTGHRGNYFFLAHWFPKLGVFEAQGWNCHQFHATTEFYSDYGVYDVRLTLPDHFVVGATGRLRERIDNADDTSTHRFHQEDVHGFTWTASPQYVVRESRFEQSGLPTVDIRLLIQPEHLGQAERHLAAGRAALLRYGSWYGPYPYGHVTLIDPAYGSGAGGMEYPTLFTCGTRLFNPPRIDSPESVTVHEMGHQFWYGIVGNNEFEHAWLDEGLNTFSTIRTLDTDFGDRLFVRRYLRLPGEKRGGAIPIVIPSITVPRFMNRADRLRSSVETDDPDTPSFLYHPATGRDISYSKVALWLATLERHLGWETLQEMLSTFFERYRFAHPTPEDFFAVADEVSGQDLSWFFDQIHRQSVSFDYAIDSVASFPVQVAGFVEGSPGLEYAGDPPDEDDDADLYRSEVVVRRQGGGRFPVEVLLVFEDGHELRESWDGQSRWRMFVHERAARLEYAVVDPERVLMLDLNYTNNSRLVKPQPRLPAVKWASRWMIWLQDLLASFAFFV